MKTLLFLWLACCLGVAGNLTLQSGLVLKDAKLERVTAEGVVVEFLSAGKTRTKILVPIRDLPDCRAKTDCLALADEKAYAAKTARKNLLQAVIDREDAGGMETAELFLETRGFITAEFAGIYFQLVETNGRTEAKFVYAVNLKNEGKADWKGKTTLTIIGKDPSNVYSKDAEGTIKAGETMSISLPLFTGPAKVHGDACMSKWRLDVGGKKIALAALPNSYEDQVGK